MNETELLKYANYLLKLALSKNPNMDDAEDLVSETLIVALNSIKNGKKIQNLKAFLSGILFHKFNDGLRRKYSLPTLRIGFLPDFAKNDELSALEKLINDEDAQNIRRSIASLTKIYREVLIRYYIHGQSVGKIANELKIPVNTVKSRLNTARQNVKQEFSMEKFEKESYEPQCLLVGMSGEIENPDNNPFDLINNDRIAQNLLILAYKEPVTIPELSGAIGISVAYIEPIIERLIEYDFMKKTGNKVFTNFIIFTDEDWTEAAKYDKKLAEKLYSPLWDDFQVVLEKLSSQDFYKRQDDESKHILEFYIMLSILENTKFLADQEHNNHNNHSGKNIREIFPSHKGWWGYGVGTIYAPDYKPNWDYVTGYECCRINGCHTVTINNYKGLESIATHSFDLTSGKTFSNYGVLPSPLSDTDVAKALYALYAETEEDLCVINSHFFENIEKLVKLNIFKKVKTSENQSDILLNIPVITKDEHNFLCKEIILEATKSIYEKHKEDFKQLFTHPIQIPEHLNYAKNFYEYHNRGYNFSMAVMYQMSWNGLYLAGRDFEKNPLPIIVLEIGEKIKI